MKKPASPGKVKELAKRLGGIFVFATRDASIVESKNSKAEIAKHKFGEFACNSCGTHFNNVIVAGLHHHCITCGSEDTKVVNEEVKPEIPSDEDSTYQTCSSCGTTSIVNASLTEMGHIHCSACGTEMTLAEPDTEDNEVLELDDMEVINVEDEDTEDSLDLDTDDATEELSEESSDDVEVVDTTEDTHSNDETKPKAEELSEEEFEVDLAEDCDSDEIEMAHLGGKIVMIKDDQIIAVLTKETAGKNADIMANESFIQAIKHTASTKGLTKAISSYGFVTNKITVNIPKYVEQRIATMSKEQDLRVTAKTDQVSASFEQSLMIASIGISKNFFKNSTDPVKAALIKELSSLGVSGATKIVDRVFATHGQAQVKEILTLAKELSSKPVDALNALSDALDMSKYVSVSLVEEDEDVVTSFATVASTVTEDRKSSQYKSPELASILGNKPLFN